jgi:hypothetical protein
VTRWQWGGPSACAVYGLLAGGEKPEEKRLVPAISWLGRQDLHGNYAVAMRCQMYPYLPERWTKTPTPRRAAGGAWPASCTTRPG